MTRLLSNLYKSRFVINNNTGKRIIDSNEKATERMEDYIRLKREEALADGEFIEGLDAESVEVVEDAQELEEPHAEENVNEEEQAQDILEAQNRPGHLPRCRCMPPQTGSTARPFPCAAGRGNHHSRPLC